MKEMMKKKWNEMNLDERQMVSGLAGIGAGLILGGLGRIRKANKNSRKNWKIAITCRHEIRII